MAIKEMAVTLDQKKKLYLKAKDVYYNSSDGKNLMSDEEFDALEDFIRSKDPRWNGFSAGATIKKKKAKLPIPIFSLDKKKPNTVDAWLGYYQADSVVLSDKLDGASLEVVYKDGHPFRAFTRGNGVIGGEVSYILPHLRIPQKVGNASFIARFEGLFSSSSFKRYEAEFKSARNAASGVLNRTDIHHSVRDLSVVLLQVLEPNQKPSKSLAWAKRVGFTVVPNKSYKVSDLSGAKLSKILSQRQTKSRFKLDGLVLTLDKINRHPTSGNPDWAIAFKENVGTQEAPLTTVIEVIWEVSSHGYLKPVVRYEPVEWDGSTLTLTNGDNARWIEANGIGPGAKIRVVRSGDIIPRIVEVVKKVKPSMPDPKKFGEFVWTKAPKGKTPADLVLVKPSSNVDVQVRQLTKFMTELEVDFMKEGNVRKLFDAGFTSVKKLLAATPEDFLRIPGVRLVTAQKLHDALHRVLDKEIHIVKLMDASGAFPRGMGSIRFAQADEKWGMQKVFKAFQANPERLKQALLKLPGWSDITASAFIKGLPKFITFVERSGIKYTFKTKVVKVKLASKKLDGVGVTWTSYRSAEEENTVTSNGGSVVPFGSKTSALLFKPSGKASTKLDKAKQKGIPVLTWEQFAKKYRL